MAKSSVVRRNLAYSLGFGIVMGLIFPAYASFFVIFKSRTLFIVFVAGCMAAGLMVGAVSFLITRATILKTIKEASSRLKAIKISDPNSLTGFRINSADELGELANGFGNTLTEIQALIALLSEAADAAVDVGQRLNTGFQKILSAVAAVKSDSGAIDAAVGDQSTAASSLRNNFDVLTQKIILSASSVIELYASLNQFGGALIDQAETIGSVIAAMEKLNRGIKADDDAHDADDGADRAGTGSELAASLPAAANTLQAAAGAAVTASRTVFTGVKDKLRLLDDIAERTNILAINAAIEAARLGQKALGFHVLADAIKALASESNKVVSDLVRLLADGDRALNESSARARSAFAAHQETVGEIGDGIATLSEKSAALRSAGEALAENRKSNEGLLGEIRSAMTELKVIVDTSQQTLAAVMTGQESVRSRLEDLNGSVNLVSESETEARDRLSQFAARLAPMHAIAERWEGGPVRSE